jgi:acetoin utilization deacetylase AcuC-like enzyme
MAVGLVLDPLFEEHETGAGHPEHPGRLAAIRERLTEDGIVERTLRIEPVAALDSEIELAHDRTYIDRVDQACASGALQIDSMDTAICGRSAEIARLASGSLNALCDAVMARRCRSGFAAMRPPGHHAERSIAMGFCLFNHVAIAAKRLQQRHGLERILIVDWDVHHGNGTQHILERDPTVFYASLHQWPLYPGTGAEDETGIGEGVGATLNCPLPPGSGDAAFLDAIDDQIVPAARAFDPDFVLVSAGFDAHRDDPLASLNVSTESYAKATESLLDLADNCCDGRFVSILEGGYDLRALSDCSALHVQTLLDRDSRS